jgi:hypothetical protein
LFPCGGGITSTTGAADQAGWMITGTVRTSAQTKSVGYHSGLGGNFFKAVTRYPNDGSTSFGAFAPCFTDLDFLIGTTDNTGCIESQCCVRKLQTPHRTYTSTHMYKCTQFWTCVLFNRPYLSTLRYGLSGPF